MAEKMNVWPETKVAEMLWAQFYPQNSNLPLALDGNSCKLFLHLIHFLLKKKN